MNVGWNRNHKMLYWKKKEYFNNYWEKGSSNGMQGSRGWNRTFLLCPEKEELRSMNTTPRIFREWKKMVKHDGIWSGPLNPSSLAWSALMLPVRAVLRTGVAMKVLRVCLRAAISCPKLQALEKKKLAFPLANLGCSCQCDCRFLLHLSPCFDHSHECMWRKSSFL